MAAGEQLGASQVLITRRCKCEACWIGAEKDKLAKPINCKRVNIASEAIRTLGIFIAMIRILLRS